MNLRTRSGLIVAVATAGLVLTCCEPISLRQTIDTLILGWSRPIVLTAPGNASLVADKTPSLDWEDAGGSAGYEVQIVQASDQFDDATPVAVAASQYEIETPLVIGDVRYWRVRAVSTEGTPGAWSETRAFEVVPSQSPAVVFTAGIGVGAWGLDIAGGYLYASAGGNGLKVFDISEPGAPVLAGTFQTAKNIWDIEVVGNWVYVSETSPQAGDHSVCLLDATSLSNIVQRDRYTTTGRQVYGLLAVGPSLLVGYSDGYYRFTMAPPSLAAPPVDNYIGPSVRVNSFAQFGTYVVYAVDQVGIRLLNANGGQEVGAAAAADPSTLTNGLLTVYDHYAYLTSMEAGYIEIFDIQDAANPVLAATYALASDGAFTIAVTGHYAYVCTFDGVVILDLADPTAPRLYGTPDAASAPVGWCEASGNYLFGSNYSTGEFCVIDLVPEA